MWLVVFAPLAAVVGGFVTLFLAIMSDDGLVVDDYYRQGKEINRVLARDEAATRRGLSAELRLDTEERLVEVALRGPSSPRRLELRLMHATRAGHDRTLLLTRSPDGLYRAALPELALGYWNVQIAAEDWRLVGRMRLASEKQIRFEILPWTAGAKERPF
jgi:hypothetical protein